MKCDYSSASYAVTGSILPRSTPRDRSGIAVHGRGNLAASAKTRSKLEDLRITSCVPEIPEIHPEFMWISACGWRLSDWHYGTQVFAPQWGHGRMQLEKEANASKGCPFAQTTLMVEECRVLLAASATSANVATSSRLAHSLLQYPCWLHKQRLFGSVHVALKAPVRTGESISVGLLPFAPRKPHLSRSERRQLLPRRS